jgi:hypothetical protein
MYLVFNKETKDLISCNNESGELEPKQVYAAFDEATMFIVNYSGSNLPTGWILNDQNEIVVPSTAPVIPETVVTPKVLTEVQDNLNIVNWTLVKEKAQSMGLLDVVALASGKLGE